MKVPGRTLSSNEQSDDYSKIVVLEIFAPILAHSAEQMDLRRSIGNAMLAHGVDHHFVRNIFFDEFVKKGLFILRMNVVVVSAEDDHEMTGKIAGVFDE